MCGQTAQEPKRNHINLEGITLFTDLILFSREKKKKEEKTHDNSYNLETGFFQEADRKKQTHKLVFNSKLFKKYLWKYFKTKFWYDVEGLILGN